ncbi:MAG: AAA domain-containing protein [Deltaproteobacteria bacterium]|nr:AAA domain-containing protein [Deltaproteobacteria bacterium]
MEQFEAGPGKQLAEKILSEVGRVIVGQKFVLEKLLVALLANGHVLLQGVPGLAKTLMVRSLASSMKAGFRRIQFTPDLLPADLTGTMVFDREAGTFSPKLGPIFTNLVLADEINRAPAKVQSALLEAMEERTVSIGGTTYELDPLFMVMATQNPIEQEGTYPLPEAQMDRFMLMVKVDYPTRMEEEAMMERMTSVSDQPKADPVIGTQEVLEARKAVRKTKLDKDTAGRYIIDLVQATRHPKQFGLSKLAPMIRLGASPRATLYLNLASRARAYVRGRDYVETDDVKAVARDVLRHRILLSYEAEAEGMTSDDIVARILARVDETVLI